MNKAKHSKILIQLNVPALHEATPRRSPCTSAAIPPASWTGRHWLYHAQLQCSCCSGFILLYISFPVRRQSKPQPLPPLMRLLRRLQNGVVLRRCVQSTCSGDTAPCSTRVRRQRRAEPYVRRLPCCACCVRKDFAFDVASFSHRGNRPLSR